MPKITVHYEPKCVKDNKLDNMEFFFITEHKTYTCKRYEAQCLSKRVSQIKKTDILFNSLYIDDPFDNFGTLFKVVDKKKFTFERCDVKYLLDIVDQLFNDDLTNIILTHASYIDNFNVIKCLNNKMELGMSTFGELNFIRECFKSKTQDSINFIDMSFIAALNVFSNIPEAGEWLPKWIENNRHGNITIIILAMDISYLPFSLLYDLLKYLSNAPGFVLKYLFSKVESCVSKDVGMFGVSNDRVIEASSCYNSRIYRLFDYSKNLSPSEGMQIYEVNTTTKLVCDFPHKIVPSKEFPSDEFLVIRFFVPIRVNSIEFGYTQKKHKTLHFDIFISDKNMKVKKLNSFIIASSSPTYHMLFSQDIYSLMLKGPISELNDLEILVFDLPLYIQRLNEIYANSNKKN